MRASPARLIAGAVLAWTLASGWSLMAGAPAARRAPAEAAAAPGAAQSQTTLHRESPAQVPASSQRPTPDVQRPAGGDYVGSEACARCHQPEYDSWKNTLHLQMTKPIAEAKVVGDFRPGTHLEAHGRAYKMEKRDGRYFITVTWGTDPPQKYEVNYTLGARRFQGYLSKLPDGRIYVLPVFWHNETKRWVDWKETTPVPDDTAHVRQIWNVECVNCHATNLVKNYEVDTNTYATTWTEMGIGCEACHGPGRPHVELTDAWAKNPRSMPAYDGSDTNRTLGRQLKIFSPRTADPRQVFDTCGYCHGNKTNKFFGFRPGDRYEDFALPFLISEPLPPNDPQGDFWTDGRPSRFNRPQALTLSGCFMRGEITCTKCHTIHGARNDHALKVPLTADGQITRESDTLCTQCHGSSAKGSAERSRGANSANPSGERSDGASADSGSAKALAERSDQPATPISFVERFSRAISFNDRSGRAAGFTQQPGYAGASDETSEAHATAYGGPAVPPTPIPDVQAHTHHAPDSPGSRCVECHMSDVNWRLFTRRRDHSFQPPVPEMTAQYGVPNACTNCHEDRSPEWAAGTMDKWYGNRERRQSIVDMADAFYRAGAGDPAVLGAVARYAVDRTRGTLIRASAAEFVGQLLAGGASAADPAMVNSLVGAAADPEPMVRIAAIRALGQVPGPRTQTIVGAHLRDDVRVVRAAAAAALFQLGVVRLDGPAGAALAAAQKDWMTSLRTFADVADDHTIAGWLNAELGHSDEAATELQTAIRLDPAAAQPHVYLGIVAARASRFADALREFRAARALDPTYPNLDRLIEQAKARVQ